MSLVEKIKQLKKEKNAVILAHCYQNIEIDEVADYVGDSLYLSRCAAKTDADIIVFAGVYFMAETAKILSPNKKVLIPSKHAGCFMADTVNLKQIREFKEEHKGTPVVCYVNSSAEVKSEADICCTSANAVSVVKSLGAKEVLFVPDMHLGSYINSELKDVNVICYPGFCPTHARILPEAVLKAREEYPDAKILAHPECRQEVLKLVDFIGSTSAIIKYVKESSEKEFVIATEKGVADRLQRDCKDKKIILIEDSVICSNMKIIELEDVYNALKEDIYEVTVSDKIRTAALQSIEKMVSISG